MSNPKINTQAVTSSLVLVARCTDGGANAGQPTELTCTSAGVLYCTATVDPAGLATSALQTSIGATAHADAVNAENFLDDIDTNTAAAVTAVNALADAVKSFTTFVAINYSGGNQTVTGSSRGFNITTAGLLYVDCAGVTNGAYAVTLGTNLLAGVTKIYQTGSTAAGSITY